jgi:hypothetical protein
MTTLEFAGSLYRTESEMLRAVVSEWVTASGANTDADCAEYLASRTDAEVVDDMLASGWTVDASRADLVAAMGQYRASITTNNSEA